MKDNNLKYLEAAPIPALIFIIAFLNFAVEPSVFHDPARLNLGANILFVTIACFAAPWSASGNYQVAGL